MYTCKRAIKCFRGVDYSPGDVLPGEVPIHLVRTGAVTCDRWVVKRPIECFAGRDYKVGDVIDGNVPRWFYMDRYVTPSPSKSAEPTEQADLARDLEEARKRNEELKKKSKKG